MLTEFSTKASKKATRKSRKSIKSSRKSRKSRKYRKYRLIGGSNDGRSKDGSNAGRQITTWIKEYTNLTDATGTGNITCNNVKNIQGVLNSYGRWCKKIRPDNYDHK